MAVNFTEGLWQFHICPLPNLVAGRQRFVEHECRTTLASSRQEDKDQLWTHHFSSSTCTPTDWNLLGALFSPGFSGSSASST